MFGFIPNKRMQCSDVSEHNMECFWWVRPGKQGSRGPRSLSQNCPHLSTSKILYVHFIMSLHQVQFVVYFPKILRNSF